MSLQLRSAVRVWTRRPAGPLLIAVGLLVATLLAAGSELALDGAARAQEADDEAALGDELARVWTPGGYTVSTDALRALQQQLAAGARPVEDVDRHLPLFLERDALVSAGGTTEPGWRVLGLPPATLAALGLPTPGPGQALVDPGPRGLADGALAVRVQRAPDQDVRLDASELGSLARTLYLGTQYVHDSQDEYQFTVDVAEDQKALALAVVPGDPSTDFDLETVSPSGVRTLYDGGQPVAPVQPNVTIEGPEPGAWQVNVHAKLASNVAFRLQITHVFDAQDVQALGRLLAGEGWRAVGASLGLSAQAVLPVSAQRADLAALGPAPGGLVVVPLERLQEALGLEDQASGLLVLARPGESVLDGLAPSTVQAVTNALASAATGEQRAFDPLRGLQLDDRANAREAQREARIDSTERLLLVVLPAGVAAGILLATWAAGLHTRRLRDELQVLATIGQSRATSWRFVVLHLAPPFVVGTLAALALSPVAGLAVARGIGLESAAPLLPGLASLAVPLAAAVPVALVAWLTVRDAIEGRDPRASGVPSSPKARWLLAGLWGALGAVLFVAVLVGGLSPATGFLVAALAAASLGLALLWAPLAESLLARPRTLRVASLGLYRTRSSHAYLALAGAAATLVVAALFSGVALSEAASPDAERESGGYEVLATTPSFTEALASQGGGPAGAELLQRTLGIEYLMRVEGTGIHSIATGDVQTVYGIDTSFAQRHQHDVRVLGASVGDVVGAVAESDDLALVTTGLAERLAGDTVFIEGPQGRLPYRVVGVLETRILEGVYVAKDALPVHFNQLGGEQRIRLGDETDADAYAAALQEAFKDTGLTATTSQAVVEERLSAQVRAGTTLQALAALGVVLLLLLVVLLGIRAQAERRSSDAVLVAMGADRRSIGLGIATETLAPLVAGFALAAALVLPLAARLDEMEGLAFPLTPIDTAGLVGRALVTLVSVLLVGVAVSVVLGRRAVSGLDQQVLRELE